jgi:hypothetical protein
MMQDTPFQRTPEWRSCGTDNSFISIFSNLSGLQRKLADHRLFSGNREEKIGTLCSALTRSKPTQPAATIFNAVAHNR